MVQSRPVPVASYAKESNQAVGFSAVNSRAALLLAQQKLKASAVAAGNTAPSPVVPSAVISSPVVQPVVVPVTPVSGQTTPPASVANAVNMPGAISMGVQQSNTLEQPGITSAGSAQIPKSGSLVSQLPTFKPSSQVQALKTLFPTKTSEQVLQSIDDKMKVVDRVSTVAQNNGMSKQLRFGLLFVGLALLWLLYTKFFVAKHNQRALRRRYGR